MSIQIKTKKRDYIDFDRWTWISLTQKCNWKCWYCDHPKINNPQTVDLDYFDEFAEIFLKAKGKSNIEVSLEGGEIGLLDSKTLDHVFDANLSETHTITTNGLFMKKGYHDTYKDKIHHILYHVVPEMDDKFDFPRYEFDPSIHVLYTMVIHKGNIKYLDKFLDYNKDCAFLPHFLQPRTDSLQFMKKEDFIEIYNIVKDKPNFEPYVKERLLNIIKFFDTNTLSMYRKLCCNIYNKTIINLPRKVIHRCCISMNTSPIPLNYENLQGAFNNTLYTFPKWDETCNECIANFVWMYDSIYMNPKTELNYRKLSFNILKNFV